ncbi:MAG: hypothetical protein ACK4XH_22760 [Microcystis sp.]|uniref:hypothetical protein n=1 Tax=Microcystis sp. TaxID=1127 RepID=UPI0039195CE1
MTAAGSLILCVISLTYIIAINLRVFVVRSTRSPARLYLRIHFTHQTQESHKYSKSIDDFLT